MVSVEVLGRHWFGAIFRSFSDHVGSKESAESVHPWPYISEIFAYKSNAGNSVKFICLLCAPKRLPSSVSHLHSVPGS